MGSMYFLPGLVSLLVPRRRFWTLFDFSLLLLLVFSCHVPTTSGTEFTKEKIAYYRERAKSMFYHAYDGYLNHAYPYDELKPLTCQGMDTWGSFSLTLVDALDTLIIMGNYTEFARASALVLDSIDFDANINVSVFETNIRVVGGLLSAHMLAAGGLAAREAPDEIQLGDGWPCSGPLLTLAERMAQKLLPAFNTMTGMPYGTVNLKYGVHNKETPITCTAGVGTFLLEFTSLSRLTGIPHYERIAMKAMRELWRRKSPIGLVGNHINVQSGAWTATDSGIGAGVDSYFEYLVKAAVMFQKPDLMRQFKVYQAGIEKYVRQDDWFMWVSMTKGSVSMPVFQSLEAFWPGVLSMIGEIDSAMRIVLTYQQVLKQYGFVPEFFNIPNMEAVNKRSGYPLRPELIESVMYLYRATKDPQLLQIGVDMMEAIDHSTKTRCGYATVQNVKDHTLEDRMESFFLSETTKYLYLLFDPDNFIHNQGDEGLVVETTSGTCVINAGGYVFNTEAHPFDPAITHCCSARRQKELVLIRDFEQNINFLDLLDLEEEDFENSEDFDLEKEDLPDEVVELGYPSNNRSEMVIELPKHHRPPEEEEGEETTAQEDQVIDYETQETRTQKAKERPGDKKGREVPGEVEDESGGGGGMGVEAGEIPHFKKTRVEIIKGGDRAARDRFLAGARKEDSLQGEEKLDQRTSSSTTKDHGSQLLGSARKPASSANTENAGNGAKSPPILTSPQSIHNIHNSVETVPNVATTGDITLKRTVEKLLASQNALGLGAGVRKDLKVKGKDGGSNKELADSIVKAFESIMKDWNKLVHVSTTLEQLKQQEAEFPCDPEEDEDCLDDSCRIVDQNTGNRALNKFLNIMYRKRKVRRKKSIIVGPHCRQEEAPKESDNYWSAIPPKKALHGVEEGERDIENASVPNIELGRFEYRTLGQMNYELMSCPSRPFLARYTGLGQVMTDKDV